MTLSLFISVCLFGLVIAITPGPNNFWLASSGAQFGFRKSIGHLIGIRLGLLGLLLLCAAGVGLVVERYPMVYQALKYVGFFYMSWLAIKLILNATKVQKSSVNTPLGWPQATLFQLANVKAWAACLSVIAGYTLPNEYWHSVLWIMLAFTVTGFFANTCWVCLGQAVQYYMNTPLRARLLNYSLSGLTFATVLPVLFH